MAKRAISPELAQLRSLARSRHRAATKKISRNKTSFGAEISGTTFDPRRDLSKVSKYNTTQLKSYIQELDNFSSRGTQFVPDSQYRPIPKSAWNQYKEAEKALNKLSAAEFNKVKHKKLPGGFTVEQQLAMTESLHPYMHNPASGPDHRGIHRKSKTVKSLESLEKLELDMRKRATPEHRKKLEEANRISVNKMLDVIGDEAMRERINKLSSEKFNFMWRYSGKFANDMSMTYEAVRKMMEKEKESVGKAYREFGNATKRRDLPQLKDVGAGDAEKFLSWIEEQPEKAFR